jgi:hypothetical protein
MYDGTLGVIGAIEALAALKRAVSLRHYWIILSDTLHVFEPHSSGTSSLDTSSIAAAAAAAAAKACN